MTVVARTQTVALAFTAQARKCASSTLAMSAMESRVDWAMGVRAYLVRYSCTTIFSLPALMRGVGLTLMRDWTELAHISFTFGFLVVLRKSKMRTCCRVYCAI